MATTTVHEDSNKQKKKDKEKKNKKTETRADNGRSVVSPASVVKGFQGPFEPHFLIFFLKLDSLSL